MDDGVPTPAEKGVSAKSWVSAAKEDRAITVKELIQQLKAEDPEARVVIAGCDCMGPARSVQFEHGVVAIVRDEPLPEWY